MQANVAGNDENMGHALPGTALGNLQARLRKANAHESPSAEPAAEKVVCRVTTEVGDVNPRFNYQVLAAVSMCNTE